MGSVNVGRRKRADVGGPQVFRSPTAVAIWWLWVLFAVANLIDLAVQGRDYASLVAAAILVLATGVAYVAAQRPRVIADKAGITVVNPLRDHHIGWARVSEVDLADLLRVHCNLDGPGPGQDGKRTKIIYCWAVHYSRRRKLAAESKARRAAARTASGRPSFGGFGGTGGFGTLGGGGGSGYGGSGYASTPAADTPAAEAEAERIVRVLNEYATTARAALPAGDTAADTGAGPAEQTANDTAEALATPARPPAVAGWLDPLTSKWDRTALLALLIPALILLVIALA